MCKYNYAWVVSLLSGAFALGSSQFIEEEI